MLTLLCKQNWNMSLLSNCDIALVAQSLPTHLFPTALASSCHYSILNICETVNVEVWVSRVFIMV